MTIPVDVSTPALSKAKSGVKNFMILKGYPQQKGPTSEALDFKMTTILTAAHNQFSFRHFVQARHIFPPRSIAQYAWGSEPIVRAG
jgi:hypothetical protein